MKTKDKINDRLGKVVSDSKEILEGKDSTEKKSTKRIISQMTL